MAYNGANHLNQRREAVELANRHYEPGRQDRNYTWVWKKHIYTRYHVEYNTFMRWIRAERKVHPELFDKINSLKQAKTESY